MSRDRPFLTAAWNRLLILNFAVPTEVVERLAPPGTELELFGGQAYVSVVGFLFRNVRIYGFRIPGHGLFEEVNLRFYVRRTEGAEVRRGVVFIQEIAPRRAVRAVARWVYNENYVTRPMTHDRSALGDGVTAGDRIGYSWRTGRRAGDRWNRLAARAAATPQVPRPGSLAASFVENYWGYGVGRDGAMREYRVTHRPWRVAPADEVVWDCDAKATFGTPLARYLLSPPATAFVVDGSPVEVFCSRRFASTTRATKSIEPDRPWQERVAGVRV